MRIFLVNLLFDSSRELFGSVVKVVVGMIVHRQDFDYSTGVSVGAMFSNTVITTTTSTSRIARNMS